MKMNQSQKKKQGIDLYAGMTIQGKWHHQHYVIKRKLGSGAIGSVYLCEHNGKERALKISDNSASMTMEVNVLQSLAKVQGYRLGPSLFDVDDWISPQGTTYVFYIMEYLHGEEISTFIKRNGSEWIGVLMLQLLDDLERLHMQGWIFGDLKTDNLLVLSSPVKIRWVDVGGTTKQGRAIKEYTEFYDRGYWGMGSRQAEPSYDLFAFVMVFLEIFYPKRFSKDTHPKKQLLHKVDRIRPLKMYRSCLQKAIEGNYQTSAQMKEDIAKILYRVQPDKPSVRRMMRNHATVKTPIAIELAGISVLSIFYYVSSLLLP